MAAGLPPLHRRVLTAAALVATLAAGTLVWSAVATSDDAAPSSTSTPSARATLRVPRHLAEWVRSGGTLPSPRADVTVVERVDDPVADAESVALSLEKGRAARWVLAVVRGGRLVTYSDVPAEARWLTFGQWLDDLVDQEAGGPGLVLADVRRDGTVVPVAPGAVVLDEAVDRDGRMAAFREARDSVFVVALVRWDGSRWFVMAERHGGASRSTAVAAARSGTTATTAEQFIAQMSELARRP